MARVVERCIKCRVLMLDNQGIPVQEVLDKFRGLPGFEQNLGKYLNFPARNVIYTVSICPGCLQGLFKGVRRRLKYGI